MDKVSFSIRSRMEAEKGTTMRYPTLAAAVGMAATTLLHVFGGGPEVHQPIQASALELPLRAVAAVLWHAVTGLLAVLLVAIQIGFAGLFLFYGQTMLGTVWTLGQWTIFAVLAVLIVWGQWGVRSPVPRLP